MTNPGPATENTRAKLCGSSLYVCELVLVSVAVLSQASRNSMSESALTELKRLRFMHAEIYSM